MSGLFSTLSATSKALEAQRYGLEVSGQNISNVNTPGYTRRTVQLASVQPADTGTSGMGGVEVVGVSAARDRLLERRLQAEVPAEQRQAAIVDALSVVEVAVGDAGASLDEKLTDFFASASELSTDPTSSTLRHEFVTSAVSLANGFQNMAGSLEDARRTANTYVKAGVDDVNTVLTQIATLNASIAKVGDDATLREGLADQRKVLVGNLTELMDVQVVDRSDGGVDISTSNGRWLVLGTQIHKLDGVPTSPSGYTDIQYDGQSISGEISGGTLGGYIHVRDTLVPGYLNDLDALATAVVTAVNAVHTSGRDANGDPGEALFTVTTGLSAAATIAVNADIVADPELVAAGDTATAGDNENIRQLAALQDANVLAGGTLVEGWARLVYKVGADAEAAQNEWQSRKDIVSQVETLYDQVSGVSLDEEAVTMLRFQRAYEANARFFQAIDQAIETLLNLV